MRRSIAIIAAAAVYAATPALAETTGFCDGKVGGAYAVPGDAACSSDFYICSWDGAMDATAQSCAAGKKVRLNGGWNYWCDAESAVPACEMPEGAGFCVGRDVGSYAKPGNPQCTNSFYQCHGGDDPEHFVCEAGKYAAKGAGTGYVFYCADISAVPECATIPTVDPVGYCTSMTGAGAFADPNTPLTTTCSNTYWTCNWSGATDANVAMCPTGKVAQFNGATPTWDFQCVDPSTIAGCSL